MLSSGLRYCVIQTHTEHERQWQEKLKTMEIEMWVFFLDNLKGRITNCLKVALLKKLLSV